MRQKKWDSRRAHWMDLFSQEVVKRMPELAGKIEWDDAYYMYNQNWSSSEAAERYCQTRVIQQPKEVSNG